MKKVSKVVEQRQAAKDTPAITVGLDLGDRYSRYCLLNEECEVVEEGRIQSTETAFRRHFEGEPRQRIALECGTHSPWVSRLLQALGHQVIVANARKIPAITASQSKNDRNDAELLARFAAHDPRLLSPVQAQRPALPTLPPNGNQRNRSLNQVRKPQPGKTGLPTGVSGKSISCPGDCAQGLGRQRPRFR